MIKRTLYFGNPAYLGRTNSQMVVRLPEVEKNSGIPEKFKKEAVATIPIEDIGVVVIDHQQVTITQGLLAALLQNNAAVIICNETHHPEGLMLPLDVHHVQHERFKAQIESSVPLRKQLWQQTVETKICNQAAMLRKIGRDSERLVMMSKNVKSGDPQNVEGRAAFYYWGELFSHLPAFSRSREGEPPNNLLNYGYAILRALTARSLVASGMLPTMGIHHSNKYNAFCLADDIMEPYRPYVDDLVYQIVKSDVEIKELTLEIKKKLFAICSIDINFDGERSPLMVGMQRTTASLAQCFEGEKRKISYPEFN
jgi:CRISPR-associated protein Cas1